MSTDERGEGAWVPLRDAEPGIHETKAGDLLFKSEYSTRNEREGIEQVDAYVLTSGEYWWGGHKTVRERDAELVRAVDMEALRGRGEALAAPGALHEAVEELRAVTQRIGGLVGQSQDQRDYWEHKARLLEQYASGFGYTQRVTLMAGTLTELASAIRRDILGDSGDG